MVESRSFARRFGGVIALVATAGAALAIGADGPWFDASDNYVDAAREIGGAILSGAIVAGLVVWFEDRRESERVDREERRDDEREVAADRRELEAAERAWRREIDIRMVAMSQTEFTIARVRYLAALSALASTPNAAPMAAQRRRGARELRAPLGNLIEEMGAMLRFLRDVRLDAAWQRWIANEATLAVA